MIAAAPTRRGNLGLFASAPLAASISATAQASPGEAAKPLTIDMRISIARRNVERKTAFLASRPLVRPGYASSLQLGESACEHDCPDCRMECAILPERLAWWTSELAALETEGSKT